MPPPPITWLTWPGDARIGSGHYRRHRQPVILTGDTGNKPGANQRRLFAAGGSHDRENGPLRPFWRSKQFGDLGNFAVLAEKHPVFAEVEWAQSGNGDLSFGPPHPPPPSIWLSRDRRRPRASAGHRPDGVSQVDRQIQILPGALFDQCRCNTLQDSCN